jgi:hypothetical protein
MGLLVEVRNEDVVCCCNVSEVTYANIIWGMSLAVEQPDQNREALRRILASRLFAEAPGQCKLLSYLAEKSLAGTADELKEYSIGTDLFAKPETYSPQSDPSVRMQTSRLRSRLDEYYRTEGADSEVVIRLPKGTFTLVFQPRPAAANSAVDSGHAASVAASFAQRLKHLPWRRGLIAAAFMILMAVLIYQGLVVQQLKEEVRKNQLDANVARLWQPLLVSPRPLTLVIGMPLWIRLRGGYFRHISVSSPADIPDSKTVQEIFRLAGETPTRIEYGFNGLGETVEAFLLGRLFQAARKPVAICRSNTLSWEELRSQDVVLLGSSKGNPHMRDMPMLVNYRLVRGGIQVVNPSKGEPALYEPTLNAKEETVADYAVVARLPGIGGNGYIMILGAESTAGNWAAAEAMTDPRFAQQLVARMVDAGGNLPEFYELIVHAEFQSLVPVKIDYVTHKVVTRRQTAQ